MASVRSRRMPGQKRGPEDQSSADPRSCHHADAQRGSGWDSGGAAHPEAPSLRSVSGVVGQPFREQPAQFGQLVSDGQCCLGYRCLGSQLTVPVQRGGNLGHQFLSTALVITSREAVKRLRAQVRRGHQALAVLRLYALKPLARVIGVHPPSMPSSAWRIPRAPTFRRSPHPLPLGAHQDRDGRTVTASRARNASQAGSSTRYGSAGETRCPASAVKIPPAADPRSPGEEPDGLVVVIDDDRELLDPHAQQASARWPFRARKQRHDR